MQRKANHAPGAKLSAQRPIMHQINAGA